MFFYFNQLQREAFNREEETAQKKALLR